MSRRRVAKRDSLTFDQLIDEAKKAGFKVKRLKPYDVGLVVQSGNHSLDAYSAKPGDHVVFALPPVKQGAVIIEAK